MLGGFMKGRAARRAAFIAIAVCFCSAVQADVIFNGFDNTSNLQINGSAATAASADGTVLRVTPAASNRAGSAFSLDRVSTAEFTSIFSFRISNSGGAVFDFNNESGADGIVFVVQNVANNVGTLGQGIGYQGITNSVGVEFDTWGNSFNNDPSQSHIGINVGGVVNHSAAGMGPTINIGDTNAPSNYPGPELDDGDRWWSWVRYDGVDLDVFLLRSESALEPTIPIAPLLSFSIDLSATLGGSDLAYVGFTSGTGAAWADHDIIYWRYTEAAIPEPTSLALLGMSGFGLLVRRVRPV